MGQLAKRHVTIIKASTPLLLVSWQLLCMSSDICKLHSFIQYLQYKISRCLIKIVIQRYSYFNGLHWSCQYGFASSRNFPWHGIHKKSKGCSSVKRQIKDYTISFFLLQTLYWNRPSSFPFEIDTSKETNAACAAPCCPFIHFYHSSSCLLYCQHHQPLWPLAHCLLVEISGPLFVWVDTFYEGGKHECPITIWTR